MPAEQGQPQQSLDALLGQAAEGDGDAWERLVGLYAPRVFALVFRQCGDRELAEEIAQATFVKIVSAIESYSEQGRFEPWLFRIAMNKLRDEMRRRKRQATPMDMSGGGRREDPQAWAAVQNQIVDDGSGRFQQSQPLENLTRQEQAQQLRAVLAQMSEADQQILYLRHTAELTFPQIAETLEQPLGTVLARGHRALKKLRKLLEETDEESTSTLQ